MGREDEIRLIAYSMWEREGYSDGLDWEHWYRAEVIWEEQNQKAAAKSTKTESKQSVTHQAKVTAARKKSQRT